MSSLSEANRLYMKKLYKEAVLKYQDACGESPALNELHFNNMARVERAINRRPLSEQEVQAGVSIVIPAVSASELKKGLLSQIVENNSYDDIEVVIVDGSTGRNIDSALMSFRKHTSIKCVDGGGRVSFASLCNLGAGNATKKYIMFLPSYITLSSDIVPMCIKLVNDFDLAGLGMASTGPGRDSFSHLGFDFTHNPDAGYAAPREITEKRSLTRATVGFCDAISGDVFFCNRLAFHEAGGFDESYLSRLAIPDLCLRLGNNGKKFWCIKSTPLDFLEGVRGQLVRDDPQTSVDHKVFKNKWSSYIGHRSSNDPLRIGRAKKEVIFRGG